MQIANVSDCGVTENLTLNEKNFIIYPRNPPNKEESEWNNDSWLQVQLQRPWRLRMELSSRLLPRDE